DPEAAVGQRAGAVLPGRAGPEDDDVVVGPGAGARHGVTSGVCASPQVPSVRSRGCDRARGDPWSGPRPYAGAVRRSAPARASCRPLRETTPSLVNTFLRCHSTVRALM